MKKPFLLLGIFLVSFLMCACASKTTSTKLNTTTTSENNTTITNKPTTNATTTVTSDTKTTVTVTSPVTTTLNSIVSIKADSLNDVPFGTPFNELEFNLTAVYSDGKEEKIEKGYYTVSDSSFLFNLGENTLTFESDSLTCEAKVNVVPRTKMKILFIGNSFSDDTTAYMYHICNSLGIELLCENLYIGGCTIDTHYSNFVNAAKAYELRKWNGSDWETTYQASINDEVKTNNWDYISVQQASGSSGIKTTYANLNRLMNGIRKNLIDSSHTQFVFNMTWAYQGNSTHAEFPKYDKSQDKMYSMILDCVSSLNTDYIKCVIPNGTAIQNARTSNAGDTLTRDGYHLSIPLGRYIAALTAVKSLTGVDIDDISYAPGGLTSEQKKIAIESVNNAFNKKFEVTESEIVPFVFNYDESKYDIVNIECHDASYYNSD